MSEARLAALARPDKWYLSAGEGFLWAPPFPDHLDRPGFWDAAHLFHFPVGPLFTVALVDAAGREIPLRMADGSRVWRPDRLVARWEAKVGDAGPGIPLQETRCVLPGGWFTSVWELPVGWSAELEGASLVAFTALPEEAAPLSRAEDRAVAWSRLLEHHDVSLPVGFRLETDGVARRHALRSEGRAFPVWALTPFPESWRTGRTRAAGGLPDRVGLPGLVGRGWIYAALARPLAGLANDASVTFALQATLAAGAEARDSAPRPAPVRATFPSAAIPTSTDRWSEAFDAYPTFVCDDERLTRYFDYRIYGLHLNRVGGNPGGYPHPAIAEGIEYFHWPISYSAQCHMMETRWSRDPAVARGSLLNFLEAQRDDGFLPGRLWLGRRRAGPEPDFYHSNWGDAVLAVDAVHPDEDFLTQAYDGLARYARWLARERDPEGSGMITVVNHYETGQEYMSRYLAVDEASDTTDWEPHLALKGVDVTVYAHRLRRALALMAQRLGRDAEAGEWEASADASARALMQEMWSEKDGIFTDVDAGTGERTGVKAAVGFYPLLTDLLDDHHLERLLAHLDDPRTFGTTWPIPSSSVDDPLFDARGLWKGKRHNCPWNGRVWPMTTSHLIEGLLRQWRAGRREVGPVAARVLTRFVHMMFDDGDPGHPNCFEHYNPYTGHPSRFRGIDDYQHSWVLDLLVRGVAGLEPGGGDAPSGAAAADVAIIVDPLPLGLECVRLEGAVIRGHQVSVEVQGDAMAATVNGRQMSGRLGTPLEVTP